MWDVYGFMKKVPGGLLLVPMCITALINTIFPDALANAGSMTTALFKGGTLTFAGFLLFASGATMDIKTLGASLKRGGVLAITHLLIAFVIGIAYVRLFGIEGIWGISAVAFVTCICACNPGVYMSIIQQYGEPADLGNFAILNILTMPAIPIIVLAMGAGGSINPMEVITVLIPFCLGVFLGNMDPKVRKMFGAATPLALPFMGFCFGSSINLVSALQAGLQGVILAALYLVIHLCIKVPVDRGINKQPGYAAIAMSSVAGIAMSVPSMLGEAYAQYAGVATSQIALCLVLTSIMSPILARAAVKRWGAPCTLAKAQAAQAGEGKPAQEAQKA
jgi:2-keto-3-deoxygluconate permease